MCTLSIKRISPTPLLSIMTASTLSSCSSEAAQQTRPVKRRRLEADTRDTTSPSPTTVMQALPSHIDTPTKQTKKPRRSVSFLPAVNVQTIPKWTPEENLAAWYSPLDIHVFKLQEGTDAALLRCIIDNASCITQLPQDVSVYRGLERLLSPQITNEIKDRRKEIVIRVLKEQDRQDIGLDDIERIAEVSRCCSEKAMIWACTLGSLV